MLSAGFKRRHIGATVALAAVASLAITGCSAQGSSSGASEAADSTKPLVISLDSSVDLLDPQAWRTPGAMVATGSVVEQLIEQTYSEDGIVRTGGTEFESALAESWTYSDDRKTLTFTLREGLTFADGSPLTADDVVWSLQRSLEGPGYVKAFLPMANVTSSDMITAVDDLTVQITTNYATPLLDNLLAMQPLGILSQESGEANATADDPWAGKWFHDNENSSGPYTVSSFDPNVSLVFEPNPNYYDQDKIANGGVTIQFVSDPSQRALLLRSGEIDVAQGIPLDQVAKMADEDGLTVVSEPSNRLEYLGFNTSLAPFDNAKVRQAIAYAVPFTDLQEQVMYGYANVSTGVVPKNMITHSAEAGTFEEDLDKAKDLLAEAGVSDFSSTLYFKQSSATEQRAAVFIQGNLAKIGITIDVRGIPDAEFTERTRARELPMYLNNFLGWGADPFYQMYNLAGTDVGTNFTNYSNPALDALMMSGFQSADADERSALSAEAQKLIFDEMPFVPIYNPSWTFVVRDGVKGVTKDNTEQLRLQYLSKE